MKGNHDLDQDDSEGEVLALEVILGKDVTRVGASEKRDGDACHRDEDAVEKISRQRDSFVGEDGGVMFEGRFGWEEIWRSLAQLGCSLQRRDHDVEERQKCADQPQDEDGIGARFAEHKTNGKFFI